jgi:MFS family permease
MIVTVIFLAIAHSILPYYTLYAIRVFSATEAHIALFAGLAILSGAIANISFGVIVDRYGPRVVAVIGACLVILAGTLALTTNSLNILFAIWLIANISNISFVSAVSLLLGEISPTAKLPLYVSVYTTISTALSAVIVLVLAPILENFGFMPLFVIVLVCGVCSLSLNVFVLSKRTAR